MPAGKVHIHYWRESLIRIFLVAFVIGLFYPLVGIGVYFGYLMGYFIDPDLDQIGITSAEGRIMHKLKVFGLPIIMWFIPYGFFIPHRSFISHSYVFSTFIRLLWLSIPIWAIIRLTGLSVPVWSYSWALGVFIGMSLSDSLHIYLDRHFR